MYVLLILVIDLYPSDLIMSRLSYTKCSRKQKLMCKSIDEFLRTRDVPIEIFALLSAQYAMCISPVLCLHYCQHSVLCVLILYYVCTTTSAESCVCKSFIVFALLPAQYAMCVNPVLYLHYCKCSVLCEDYDKTFVVFAQCTASAVCHAGATISPLIIFILLFLLFLPIPTNWEWMSTGSSIITAS